MTEFVDVILAGPLTERVLYLAAMPAVEALLDQSEYLTGSALCTDFREDRKDGNVLLRFVYAPSSAGRRAIEDLGLDQVQEELGVLARAAVPTVVPGVLQIMDERARQLQKGYDLGGDARYRRGELRYAAAAFVLPLAERAIGDRLFASTGWGSRHDVRAKNKGRLHALRVAGALCAAEIDRAEAEHQRALQAARGAAQGGFRSSFVKMRNEPKPPSERD